MSTETQKATAAAAEESEGAIEEKIRSSVQRAYATPEASSLGPISPQIHSEPKEIGLYNGISNRARGWKSKKGSGDALDNRPPAYTTVKRWDAVSKTWQPWDSIRRVSPLVDLSSRTSSLLTPGPGSRAVATQRKLLRASIRGRTVEKRARIPHTFLGIAFLPVPRTTR